MEKWGRIKDYEGFYEISDLGRVRTTERRVNTWNAYKTLKSIVLKNQKGKFYLQVGLNKRNVHKTKLIHRLVASAFVDNPENKPEVNHKDGNKHNNHASNLEWMTSKENHIHSFKVLGRKGTKSMLGKFGKYHNRHKDYKCITN